MFEYFHVFVDGELKLVSLSLAEASNYSMSLKADGFYNSVEVKSYTVDPAVLAVMSDSYDAQRSELEFVPI